MSDPITPETQEQAARLLRNTLFPHGPIPWENLHDVIRYQYRRDVGIVAPVLLAPVLARLEESEAQLAAVRNALENADSDMEAPELLDVIHGALSALGGSNG